jgi:tRNA U54 and U55 pseudouridine synthase Pus10
VSQKRWYGAIFACQTLNHLKSEINREVGKRVAAKSGLIGDTKKPDLTAILNISEGTVEVQIRPLFLYGRNLKYERGSHRRTGHADNAKGLGVKPVMEPENSTRTP